MKKRGRHRDNRRKKKTVAERKAIARERLALQSLGAIAGVVDDYVGGCDCDVCRRGSVLARREHDPTQLKFQF